MKLVDFLNETVFELQDAKKHLVKLRKEYNVAKKAGDHDQCEQLDSAIDDAEQQLAAIKKSVVGK